MALKFIFDFITTQFGQKESDEPIGWDAAGISVEKEEGRKGIDISYSGSNDAKYRITDRYGEIFQIFLIERLRFGHQAKIKFYTQLSNTLTTIGQVDAQTMRLIDDKTIEFTVIQESELSRFKERFDVDVDCFSTTDLDDNPIAPVVPISVLLPAKPAFKKSTWENTLYGEPILPYGNQFAPGFFNTIKNITAYGISATTNSLFDNAYAVISPIDYPNGKPYDFRYIIARDNLFGVTATVRLQMRTEWTNINNPTNQNMQVVGLFMKGSDTTGQTYEQRMAEFFQRFNDPNNQYVFYNTGALGPAYGNYTYEIDTTLTVQLPPMQRGEVLYMFFVHVSPEVFALSRNFIYDAKVDITANQVGYNTVIQALRYRDVIKYAIKSSSQLNMDAPRWEYGGQFYDQFITNPNLMRALTDKPFNISCKDIFEDNIQPEVNGDYQVQPDGTVLVGINEDFYRPVLIGSYTDRAIEGFEVATNEDYACNKIEAGFENYASQKENETDNSNEIVHGEGQWFVPNDSVNNSFEIKVGFIRDASLISGRC